MVARYATAPLHSGAVRATPGMPEKDADLVVDAVLENMLESAGILFHVGGGHGQDVLQESFGQPVPSDDIPAGSFAFFGKLAFVSVEFGQLQ